MSDPTFNRRTYVRVRTEQLVAIGRLDDREGLAHALDVSLGGIRFQCVGLDARLGDMLKVTLTLGNVTKALVGQIMRVENLDEFTQDVALSFVKMDDETRRHLVEHLPQPEDASWHDERRSYARVKLESVLSVVRVTHEAVRSVARAEIIDVVAQARDLSLGGIRLQVEGMDLELGDVLRVTLELGGQVTTVIGQLVRATEIDEFRQEIALAFLEVDPASLELLQEHLPVDDEA